MTSRSTYSRNPIVEAILDIQVDVEIGSTEELLKCQQEVKGEYPDLNPTHHLMG